MRVLGISTQQLARPTPQKWSACERKQRIRSLNRALGRELRKSRIRHRVTRVRLAFNMALTEDDIWKIETGVRSLTTQQLFEISTVMGVDHCKFAGEVLEKARVSAT